MLGRARHTERPSCGAHRGQAVVDGLASAGGCTSWYKTADGHITNNWSGSVEEYKAAVRELQVEDYEVLEGAPA